MRAAIIASLFVTSVLAQSATTSDFASNPTETGTGELMIWDLHKLTSVNRRRDQLSYSSLYWPVQYDHRRDWSSFNHNRYHSARFK